MSESAKLVTRVEGTPDKVMILNVGLCRLCSKPIAPKDQGQYCGDPAHRLCAAEQKVDDAFDEMDRLRADVERLNAALFGPIPREAH